MNKLNNCILFGFLGAFLGFGIGYSLNLRDYDIKFSDLNKDGYLDAIVNNSNKIQFFKGNPESSFILVDYNDSDYSSFIDSYSKLYRIEEKLTSNLVSKLEYLNKEIPLDRQ